MLLRASVPAGCAASDGAEQPPLAGASGERADAGASSWQHSDTTKTGSYTCEAGIITALVEGGGDASTLTAQLSPDGSSLTWSATTYTRVPM